MMYRDSPQKNVNNSLNDKSFNRDNPSPSIFNRIASLWIPPNDRELLIRAKLHTGWSSRSSVQTTTSRSSGISESEFSEIERVMQRAAQVEKKELSRINRLYDRYTTNYKPKGNGESTCIMCNTPFGSFGSFGASTPRVCSVCLKNCCSVCSVDTVNASKQIKWLCKICSEYSELWKKSGAWFSQRIPVHENADNTDYTTDNSNNNSIISNMSSNKLVDASVNKLNLSTQTIKAAKNISKLSIDSDEDEEEDDDEIKSNHSNSNKVANSDSVSLSAFSDSKSSISYLGSNKNVDFFGRSSGASSIKDLTKNEEDNISQINQTNKEDSIDTHFRLYASTLPTGSSTVCSSTPKLQVKEPINESPLEKESITRKFAYSLKAPKVIPPINKPPVEKVDTKLGRIQFTVIYNSGSKTLKVHLISATGLPAKDSNGLSDPYVKLHLLPSLAKSTKLRSKTIYKNLNPNFNETLTYEAITIEDLNSKTLRLTVLDEDKVGFDTIGEYRVLLRDLLIDEEVPFDVPLEEVKKLGDDLDTNIRGKINFSLKYSKISQTLFVKINRCTQLLPMDKGKSSDPFVEIGLVPSEKANKQKTTTKWKTLDPEYMEEFKFSNIDMNTLVNKTIEIVVWDKDIGTANDFIGVVRIGSKESGDELTHFYTMIKNPELYQEAWHTLRLDDALDNTKRSHHSSRHHH